MKCTILAWLLAGLSACTTLRSERRFDASNPSEIKSELELRALKYFLENSHPQTGLVRDAANNFSDTPASNRMCSLSATGFGLAVIANASTRGLVEPAFARAYTLKVLRFSEAHIARRKGWFLHFVDWETGVSVNNSEYSTIDTALFMAGALYAAQVLHDAEITEISARLYRDMDFQDALTRGGSKPGKRTLSMGYDPVKGYVGEWDMYAEQRVLLLLGIGHPTNPLPPWVWTSWARPVTRLPTGEKIMGLDSALFIHQYSDLFVDFRSFQDNYDNYFTNGILASRQQRHLAQKEKHYRTFGAGFWGLSAGAAPGDGYEVWQPVPTHYAGTVCIDCALGSAMYMPQEVLADAGKWASGTYRDRIWGKYGITDSVDLDQGWYSDHVYGITVGPAFLSLANTDPRTSLWKDFMAIPEIRLALSKVQTTRLAPTAAQDADVTSPPKDRKPGSL